MPSKVPGQSLGRAAGPEAGRGWGADQCVGVTGAGGRGVTEPGHTGLWFGPGVWQRQDCPLPGSLQQERP